MARPKKEIDEEEVFKLASFGLINSEIASIVGCHKDTLVDRFSETIKEGHERCNGSLRRKQYEVAMAGNVGMLIWLGKQRLGQTEKVEQSGEVTVKEAIENGKRFIGRVEANNGHSSPPASVLG